MICYGFGVVRRSLANARQFAVKNYTIELFSIFLVHGLLNSSGGTLILRRRRRYFNELSLIGIIESMKEEKNET
jgi:hypothetical protein